MRACTCPSRLFSYFLPEHVARPREFWWAVAISALLGALYGAFVSPFWTEAVGFGQAWAGLIDYSHSPWGSTMFADTSLQITLPALLLKAGADPWRLSQYLCGFFCALSFAAITASCFVFTRHGAFSVSVAVLMITYRLIDAHGYPALYPMGLSQFGQTGQYFCLLALATVAAGFPLAGGLIGGMLGGMHAVWGACFVLGSVVVCLWRWPHLLKRLAIGFCITLILSVGLQYMGVRALPKHEPYQAPVIPPHVFDQEQERDSLMRQGITPSPRTAKPAAKASASTASALRESAPAPANRIRSTFEGHNKLFADAKSPLKAAITFFTPSTIFLLFSLLILRRMKRDARYAINLPAVQRMIWMVAVPLICVGIFKIYEEIDPKFYALGIIHADLPGLVIRAIVNRWMNLSTLMVPILFVSVLFFLIRDYKSFFALLALSVIAFFGRPFWSVVSFHLAYKKEFLNTILGIGLIVLTVWGVERRYFSHPKAGRLLSILFAGVVSVFLATRVFHYGHTAYRSKIYTGSDARDAISDRMRNDPGVLIVSPNVDGAEGYYPQIRAQRPILLPTRIFVYDASHKNLVHVYCYTNPLRSFADFYADVKPCFEQRPVAEWALIARELPAGGVITPDSWKLKLPLTASGGGFNYYRLPVRSSR